MINLLIIKSFIYNIYYKRIIIKLGSKYKLLYIYINFLFGNNYFYTNIIVLK